MTRRQALGCVFPFSNAIALAQTPKKAARAPRQKAPAARSPAETAGWPQWAGPHKNFTSDATGLAASWPADGPRRLWSRPLGDGYSAIAEENGILYTAFRRRETDVVVALNEVTGETLWEFNYPSPFRNAFSEGAGPGPYAMPQVVGDRIIAAGGTAKIWGIEKMTGKFLWGRDLYRELDGTRVEFGYACHALAYKDFLILLAGGRGSAAVALRQSDGGTVWKRQSFKNAYSSPLLIELDARKQVVALVADKVVGFDPDTGADLWQHDHKTEFGIAVSTPVWGTDNILLISSAYGGGTRALQLARVGDRTRVTELWHNNRIQTHFGSIIRVGEHVYTSSGHQGPGFLTCYEAKTGRILWQTRDFAKAQLLLADRKLIVLDEEGTLGLVTVSPQGAQVLAKASVLRSKSWTPPTLVGTRLFLRDRATVLALDLGSPA